MFCPFIENNDLLSFRCTDRNTLQIVDDEFYNRSDIKIPLECLTNPSKMHMAPYTISYFLRKRLWEIKNWV